MVSIYNDYIGNRVLISDVEGEITPLPYSVGSMSVADSEGLKVSANLADAQTADGGDDSDVMDVQNTVVCQNADAGSATPAFTGAFHAEGTNTCYKGKTFTFEGLTLMHQMV